MLRHLGLPNFADNISQALNKTISSGKVKTRDIGGTARTDEFTFEVIKNLRKWDNPQYYIPYKLIRNEG